MGGGSRGSRISYAASRIDNTGRPFSQTRNLRTYTSVTSSDVTDLILPILVEVGKTIYPPAAPILELGYALYVNRDRIQIIFKVVKEFSEGDTEGALTEVGKGVAREVIKGSLQTIQQPHVSSFVEKSSKTLNENGFLNSSKYEVTYKRAAKRTAEAALDKVNTKVADKIIKEGDKDE